MLHELMKELGWTNKADKKDVNRNGLKSAN